MTKVMPSLFLCLINITLFAQTKTAPLKPGDTMPDISLGKVINYKQSSLKYADIAGKALILDFWATYCSPCVKELMTLDTLQKYFGDKIIVMPVTSESGDGKYGELRKFFNKYPSIQLPSIIEDNYLKKLFPHEIIPHMVWIGPDGIIKSITSGREVTKENITELLQGAPLSLKQKKDIKFDATKPLFINGNGGSGENFIYRSILTDNIDGMYSFFYAPVNDSNRIKEFTISNSTPLNLFYYAFNMCRNIAPMNVKNVIIESGNSSTQLSPEEYLKSINTGKLYCYTMNLPYPVSDSLFFRKYYLDELNKYFDITGRVEKRKMPSLTIIRTGGKTNELLLSRHASKPKVTFEKGHKVIQSISNKSFNYVVELLRTFPDTPPIINNTGYTNELIEMELNLNWKLNGAWNKPLDLQAVRKVFNRYGLDIIETPDGMAEVLVISKKKAVQ